MSEEDDHPLWARIAVANPFAALGFVAPGFLTELLLVLEVFSCAS